MQRAFLNVVVRLRPPPRLPRKRFATCIQRSESWRSPTFFVTKAQALDWEVRRGMVPDDRTNPSQALGRGAVPVAFDLAVVVLLGAAVRGGDEP